MFTYPCIWVLAPNYVHPGADELIVLHWKVLID